ncbi:transposase [Streptomyces sp. CoT10]|uniref:transposase n=1 Tax=Streptomyces sp. CoT10 TaxID=2875762 RepID=UPI001CD505EB|nr:transposase [Streptomyces sp. CoT10]
MHTRCLTGALKADVVRELQAEGRPVDPLDLTQAYLTEHIKQFGEYSPTSSASPPDDYNARLDVDFSVLGGNDKAAAA